MVYFIQAKTGGPIKIGCSETADSVAERRRTLQIGHPESLVVLGMHRGGPTLEAEYHRRFAAGRVRGEWFEPTESLVALAKGCPVEELERWRVTGVLAEDVLTLRGRQYVDDLEWALFEVVDHLAIAARNVVHVRGQGDPQAVVLGEELRTRIERLGRQFVWDHVEFPEVQASSD